MIDDFEIIASSNQKIYLYSFITGFEYALFSFFIFLNVVSKPIKKVIIFSIAAFTIFQIIYTLLNPNLSFDSVSIGIETILILFFSFYFLYEQINKPEIIFLYNTYHFWIITGFIIYLAGSFFIYLFAIYLPPAELAPLWPIINIFSVLKNIFFSIGILVFALHLNPKKMKFKSFYHNLTQ